MGKKAQNSGDVLALNYTIILYMYAFTDTTIVGISGEFSTSLKCFIMGING